MNSFQWLRAWIWVLVAAIGIVWFLTRTCHRVIHPLDAIEDEERR